MKKLLENNVGEFKKWSEENDQDKTFLLIYRMLNAMRSEHRQLLSHIVSEFSHVNTSIIQHQANNKEYISSLCDSNVEACIDKVCLMIPLLNADNKDTANVFTKLVFHFILNLQSNQVPKVSSLISFMQHKNVFKSEDVIHLESCLQQWLKEDQKVKASSKQTPTKNDKMLIANPNDGTEVTDAIAKRTICVLNDAEYEQPQNTTIKTIHSDTHLQNNAINTPPQTSCGKSSTADENTATTPIRKTTPTHSNKAPTTKHPILKRTLSIIPGSTHLTNDYPPSVTQVSKTLVTSTFSFPSNQILPSSFSSSSSPNTTITTNSAFETQSSRSYIESSRSLNDHQPQQTKQHTCEYQQSSTNPSLTPPLLFFHPPISSRSSNTSTCSNDSINTEESDPSMLDINQWLKSLRLHKYVAIFHKLTYHQMMQLNDQFLENQGVTKGARRKMLIEIQRLSERPSILVTIGQRIRQGDNVKQCLNDLKPLIFAPIHSHCALCIHNNNNNNNNQNNIANINTNQNYDTVDANNNIVNNNIYNNNPEEDTSDIPHIVTQLFSKLTDRLLLSPYEPAVINTSLQLFHHCISHPSFNEEQQSKLRSFSAQLLSMGLYGKGPSRAKLSYTQSLLPNSNRMRQPVGPRHSTPIHNAHHKLKPSLSNYYIPSNNENLRNEGDYKRAHTSAKDRTSELFNVQNPYQTYKKPVNKHNLDSNKNVLIVNNNLTMQRFLQTVPKEQLCVLLQHAPTQLIKAATLMQQTTQPQKQQIEEQICDLRQQVLQHQHLQKQRSFINLSSYHQQNIINQLYKDHGNKNIPQNNCHLYNFDNTNSGSLMNHNMTYKPTNNTHIMLLPCDQALKVPISRTRSAPGYTAAEAVDYTIVQQAISNEPTSQHNSSVSTTMQATTTSTIQSRHPTRSKVPSTLEPEQPITSKNPSSSDNQNNNNSSTNQNTDTSTNKNAKNSQTTRNDPPIITLNSPNEVLHANLISLCLNMTEHALSNND